jgi:hypothetical protein
MSVITISITQLNNAVSMTVQCYIIAEMDQCFAVNFIITYFVFINLN